MSLALMSAVVVGYLIGTISFSRMVAWLVLRGEDISVTEYAVPGTNAKWTYRGVSATSVLERAGWRWGLAVIVLDAAKAFVPTIVLRLLYPDSVAYLVVAVAVIVGHVWPVWWRFVGGRGQSSLLGALLAIDFWAIPFAAIGGALIGIFLLTSVYMARNMGPALLVAWFGLMPDIGARFWFAVAINLVYWIAIRPDLAEEANARRERGIPAMPYRERLRRTWHDFFEED